MTVTIRLTVVLFVAAPTALRAQVAAVTALGEIVPGVITVSPMQDLAFGDVVPGTPTTVDPQASTTAGRFEIQGVKGAEIMISHTLPVVLAVGAFSMPISFGPTSGCHRNRDQQNACQYFDPTVLLITTIRNQNPPNNLRVTWIGGTVSPALGQFPGVYKGTITLTAAYTGN